MSRSEIESEQAYVTALYGRLDVLRAEAAEGYHSSQGLPSEGTHQGQSERSLYTQLHARRESQLNAVERGLCIGRLDVDDGDRLYIGRIGLYDKDYEPVLVDWRAPAATAFYRATPAERHGVRRRRHIGLQGRTVVRLDDDVLDFSDVDVGEQAHLTGEAALLSSLRSARTGRMSDIVATIQGEQDRVIRSGLSGILVVEGGPGTGKTVVALHRAAYLLYTYRDQLANRGVLVLGPNATFLRYIDQVLPGLGETDVMLSSVGELYPGAETSRVDAPETAVVKGDVRMVDVIRQAVASYERAPEDGLEIQRDRDTYVLDTETCGRIRDSARDRARPTKQPHNRVRRFVVSDVLDELTQQELDKLEAGLGGVDVPEENEDEVDQEIVDLLDRETVRGELRDSEVVREALDYLWPELTPERVLADLYRDPLLREEVAAQLTQQERDALQREDAEAWTVGDVPLLDEIAPLVGDPDATVYREADDRVRRQIEEARRGEEERRVMEDAHEVRMDMAIDEEVPIPIDPELVLERYHTETDDRAVAEKAEGDREWRFGHVIVDEAQELSPMAWRLIARRCPALSMTVVGDIAQTGAADGTSSWSEVLDAVAEGRWRRERLSINYRTPEPIMAVAADVLAASGSDGTPPRSVRGEDAEPWARHVSAHELASALPAVVRREHAELGEGKLAVVMSEARFAELAGVLCAELEGTHAGADEGVLDAPVAVLRPREVKGLEFDAAIVVDPDGILAGSARGHSDLYVALTRPTRRLGVVHTGPLPNMLARLRTVGD